MKWRRRVLIGLLILAAAITGLWWEENWRGQKIWEESCARLRAAGEPVDIADIIPPMISDEENVAAAPIFAELFHDEKNARLLRAPFEADSDPDGTLMVPPKSRPFKAGDDSLIREWRDYVRRRRPSLPPVPEGLPPAEATLFLLSDFDEEWRAVAEAVKRPSARWPLDHGSFTGSKAPHFQVMQRFRQRSEPRLLAYAAGGDWEAYSKGLSTTLQLSRHLFNSASGTPAQAVCIAYQMLELKPVQNVVGIADFGEPDLQAIQEQVSKLTLQDALPAMRAELVTDTSSLLRLKRSELNQWLGFMADSPEGPQRWLHTLRAGLLSVRPRGWKLAEVAAFQDRWVSRLHHLWSAGGRSVDWKNLDLIQSELDALEKDSKWLSLDKVTTSLFQVQVSMFKKLVERQALANSIAAWCAVQRYQLAHGSLPKTLQELQPKYLESVPVDPIDGLPLRYVVKGDDAFILYSTGWNRKDDGGRQGSKRDERDWVWASQPTLLDVAAGQPEAPSATSN